MASERRGALTFWAHQAAEYVIAVLVLSQALQAEAPAVPVVGAVLVLLLAATADGPLAAFHGVPRPVHRVLDVVVAVALVGMAVVFRDQLDGLALVLLVGAGLALAVLVYRTDYRPPRRRTAASGAGGAASGPGAAAPAASRSEDVGRAAGRALGRTIRAYKGRADKGEDKRP